LSEDVAEEFGFARGVEAVEPDDQLVLGVVVVELDPVAGVVDQPDRQVIRLAPAAAGALER
jgi:hypothetical protein